MTFFNGLNKTPNLYLRATTEIKKFGAENFVAEKHQIIQHLAEKKDEIKQPVEIEPEVETTETPDSSAEGTLILSSNLFDGYNRMMVYGELSAIDDMIDAFRNANAPANTYASMTSLLNYGFTTREIAEYFENKPFMETRPDGGGHGGRAYFIKEGIVINGKSVDNIKDLMLALGKDDYFNNIINNLVSNFSKNNAQIRSELLKVANEFLEQYNGEIEQFSTELGKVLAEQSEKLSENNVSNYEIDETVQAEQDEKSREIDISDYENYELDEDVQKFVDYFLKGDVPLETVLEELEKAGVEIKDTYVTRGSIMDVNIHETIHFVYNGQECTMVRKIEPTEVKDAPDASRELKTIARNFENGTLTIAKAMELLKAIGATDIVKVYRDNFKDDGVCKQIGFSLNGVNYKITSLVPEDSQKTFRLPSAMKKYLR